MERRHRKVSPGTKIRRGRHASESPPPRYSSNLLLSMQDDNTGVTGRARMKKRPSLSSALDMIPKNDGRPPSRLLQQIFLSRNILMGLSVAGVAQALLTTIFRLFHVDLFLEAYHLPLESYSTGTLVVSIFTTISSVVASWMVDTTATYRHRTKSVGRTGVWFVGAFLLPFFGYHAAWGTLHFIVTVSLYQTLYSYTSILLGSIVTDSHTMTQETRVRFMASGKALNLVASFVTGRIALRVFGEDNLHPFRLFLGILACLTLFLFAMADSMMRGTWLWQSCRRLRHWTPLQILMQKWYPDVAAQTPTKTPKDSSSKDLSSSHHRKPRKLHWQRIVRDFLRHHNFKVWGVIEMLLHMQITFNFSFLKTFVDVLLLPDYGRDTCDWLLSLMGPLSQLVTIFAYIPIQKWGYRNVYLLLFGSNLCLSVLSSFVGESSSLGILAFLMVYYVSTRAVQSAGFHLAMADMVLEMKRKHADDGRYDEPSVAGLFMGANALLCKPVESLLPMLAANVMEFNGASRRVLFHLLVVPPMACSILQMIAWSSFNLTPGRVSVMRQELRERDWDKTYANDNNRERTTSGELLNMEQSTATKSAVSQVELVLLDLSAHDATGNNMEAVTNLLNRVFASAKCYDAMYWLENKPPSLSTAMSLRKDIERFVRSRDRLLSLGSVLLKSRAFLQLHGPPFSIGRPNETTLVRLPRTIHKKPYVPRQGENGATDDGSLSVSHQFPYVGAARLWKSMGDQNLVVGCDIVVQEPLNTQLYSSWGDFLQVFRESFTAQEWEIIVSAKTSQARLHEFFFRWAVKEAYTKALGVGLGFDFASFVVSFQLPARCSNQLASFLAAKSKPRQIPMTLRGTVKGPNLLETWEFTFVNLSQEPWSWVCIAVGPIQNIMTPSVVEVHAQWTTIDALVSW